MCNENTLKTVLEKVTSEYKRIYGTSLKSVILYGSYARGDFDNESDIDVVALVEQERIDLQRNMKKIVEFSSEISLDYNVMLSPSAIPYSEFEKYKDDLPYYTNIIREGVVLNVK